MPVVKKHLNILARGTQLLISDSPPTSASPDTYTFSSCVGSEYLSCKVLAHFFLRGKLLLSSCAIRWASLKLHGRAEHASPEMSTAAMGAFFLPSCKPLLLGGPPAGSATQPDFAEIPEASLQVNALQRQRVRGSTSLAISP